MRVHQMHEPEPRAGSAFPPVAPSFQHTQRLCGTMRKLWLQLIFNVSACTGCESIEPSIQFQLADQPHRTSAPHIMNIFTNINQTLLMNTTTAS